MTKRFFYVCAVLILEVVWAAPSSAEFVLRWSDHILFPAYPGGNTSPFPSVFLGDVDGDGQTEFVGTLSTNRAIEIRDASSGVVKATLDVFADTGGQRALSVTVADLDNSLPPEIVVTLMGDCCGQPTGLAVYGWNSTTAAPLPPTLQKPDGLRPASPNPFLARTTLSFTVDAPGKAELEIFDVSGRLVRRLVEPSLAPGEHTVEWAGDNEAGHRLPAGTYFYSLKVNGRVLGSHKAVMLQ